MSRPVRKQFCERGGFGFECGVCLQVDIGKDV